MIKDAIESDYFEAPFPAFVPPDSHAFFADSKIAGQCTVLDLATGDVIAFIFLYRYKNYLR